MQATARETDNTSEANICSGNRSDMEDPFRCVVLSCCTEMLTRWIGHVQT